VKRGAAKTVTEQIAQWQRNAAQSSDQSVEAKDWRRRLARIAKQTTVRKLARDWNWFGWLEEYARMRAETIYEDFKKYDAALISAGKEKRRLAKLRASSNAARGERKAEVRRMIAAGTPVHKSPRQVRRLKK
jgi:hypothetical protein